MALPDRWRPGRRSRARSLLVAAGAGALMVSGLAIAPSLAADTDSVCAQARTLNNAALPQQALSLIDDLRGSSATDPPAGAPAPDSPEAACASERNEALTRIALAQQLADQVPLAAEIDTARADLAVAQAGASPSPSPSPTPSQTPDQVQDATTALDDAQDALKKQTCATPSSQASPLAEAYLDAALACDSENETAVALAAPDTRSGPQKLAASWDDTYKAVIAPLVDLAVAALVIVLGLLILARLLIGWIDFSSGLASIDPMSRSTKAVVGSLLIAAAALAGTAAWGGWTASQYWPWGVVGAVLCGLLGAFLLAWAWSQGRSVAVTVMRDDGDEDRAASAHVAALLFDLGATPPAGLEVSRGADTTSLASAGLSTTPEGRLAALAYRIAQLLAPTNPWQVRVEVAGPDLHTVTVTRNGRMVGRALVDREQLHLGADGKGEPKRQPDLLRMDAAAALMALRDGMAIDGLAGATEWRSLGWHYVATTDLSRTDAGTALLARAVTTDPGNLLAQQALWNFRYRTSASPAELKAYLAWLQRFIAMEGIDPSTGRPRPGLEPLVLRAMVSQVSVAINLGYLSDDGTPVADFPTAEARRAALGTEALYEALVDTRAHVVLNAAPAAREFAQAIAHRVMILGWSATRPEVPRAAGAPKPPPFTPPVDPDIHGDVRTPFEAYQAACYFASRHELAPGSTVAAAPDAAVWAARAITHLRYADATPDLATWRSTDPQLAWLRARDDYKAAFPAPRPVRTPPAPRPIIRASSTRP